MATIKTFTHSITINPGEVFTLPPNSEILFATDPSGLESVCVTIPETELKCYRMHWVRNEDPEGSFSIIFQLGIPVPFSMNTRSNAYEDDEGSSATIEFSKVGGMGTSVTTGGIDFKDLAALEAFLAASQFAGALMDRKYKYGSQIDDDVFGFTAQPNGSLGNDHSGYFTYDFYFKTTEEIADNFYLELTGSAENIIKKARILGEEIDCETYPVTSDVTVCDPLAPPQNTNDPKT